MSAGIWNFRQLYKLLSDNGILLSTNLKPVYSYDSTLGNIDTNNIGFPYNTNTFKTTNFAPLPLMNDDGDILLNDDGRHFMRIMRIKLIAVILLLPIFAYAQKLVYYLHITA